MIRINLLPVRQQRKDEAARRELGLIGMIGAAVIVACLGAWALSSARLSSIVAENGALQQEINQFQEQVKEVEAVEKAKTELERKLAVIADLREKKRGPVHMLDELAMATPERVVLTKLQQKSESLEISGISVSNEVISQFLRALDASEYFEAVYLKNIEALPKGKNDNLSVVLKKFELTAKLVTPKAKTADAKQDKPAEKAAETTPAPAEGAAPTPAPAAPAAPETTPAPAPATNAPAAGGGA